MGQPHDLVTTKTCDYVKILVLTSTYSRRPGDTEPRFVDNLCHYLKEAGNEVDVVAPHAPGIPTEETLEGIPVYRHQYWIERWQSLAYEGGILPSIKENPLRLLQVPGFLISQLLLVRKLLKAKNYDVIHAHWIIPQGLVVALLKMFSDRLPPIVITSHGGDLFSLKGRVLGSLKKWIIRAADKLTVVSSAMKARALEQELVESAKAAVIPMGVDTEHTFIPPAPGSKRSGLLFVGRLVDKKGIEYLIEAMPAVLAKFPDTRLQIIGDGPMEEALQRQSEALGLASSVQFLGARINTEIPIFLQDAAITLFPSIVTNSGDQEGTPVAIMEALACGTAAIVSDYPGARDIINDRQNGVLVPQRSPEALAQAIIELQQTPTTREAYGAAGRETVRQRHDWSVISRQFLASFEQATTARR